ncbi:DUF6483 family protein [Blautia sp.]|uniref:DUF6483 family protein n=1 Tax=Blautia sp. TaxID=1955243 RepID=UPI0026331207|nr:DUF6483 family protein [Blautia sp.]
MDYEQDYVMRMIKDMVRALALLIFGKRDIRYEIPEENARTEEDDLYIRILQMADRGEINEAENILLTELSKESSNYVVMAADFYQHIAEYSDEFLEEHNYSRDEILEGLESIAEEYGILDRDIRMEI